LLAGALCAHLALLDLEDRHSHATPSSFLHSLEELRDVVLGALGPQPRLGAVVQHPRHDVAVPGAPPEVRTALGLVVQHAGIHDSHGSGDALRVDSPQHVAELVSDRVRRGQPALLHDGAAGGRIAHGAHLGHAEGVAVRRRVLFADGVPAISHFLQSVHALGSFRSPRKNVEMRVSIQQFFARSRNRFWTFFITF
jgi:hypothetical protein